MTHDDRNDRPGRESQAREPQARQPLFNGPFLALVLPMLLMVCYAGALISDPSTQQALVDSFALNPILVRAGQWSVLFTYAFLHGSLLAVLINAGLILIFGASFARAVGPSWRGALSYLGFFEICSIGSALAFCLLHGHDNVTVMGASGAASGLVGAAMRLPMLGDDSRTLRPFLSGPVIVMTLLVCVYNGYYAFTTPASEPVGMAWESHLAAYFLGLILVEPWLRVFHPRFFEKHLSR